MALNFSASRKLYAKLTIGFLMALMLVSIITLWVKNIELKSQVTELTAQKNYLAERIITEHARK